MLTALRREIQAALAEIPARRKPALRRSDDPDALLATDLLLAADDGDVEQFKSRLVETGWRVWEKDGWLLLDADVPIPAYGVPSEASGETGCCISVLLRHPEGDADPRTVRAIVKAAESGRPALDKLCGALHAEWAASLREHRRLPGGLLPYLCHAENMTK